MQSLEVAALKQSLNEMSMLLLHTAALLPLACIVWPRAELSPMPCGSIPAQAQSHTSPFLSHMHACREVELGELRNRIVRMLFKQLMAPSEERVDLAQQALAIVITHTRMPKVWSLAA